MDLTRRQFLKSSAAAAGVVVIPTISKPIKPVGRYVVKMYEGPFGNTNESNLLVVIEDIHFERIPNGIKTVKSSWGEVIREGVANWCTLGTLHGDVYFVGSIGEFSGDMLLSSCHLIQGNIQTIDHL